MNLRDQIRDVLEDVTSPMTTMQIARLRLIRNDDWDEGNPRGGAATLTMLMHMAQDGEVIMSYKENGARQWMLTKNYTSLDDHAASLPDGVTVLGVPGRAAPRRRAPVPRYRALLHPAGIVTILAAASVPAMSLLLFYYWFFR